MRRNDFRISAGKAHKPVPRELYFLLRPLPLLFFRHLVVLLLLNGFGTNDAKLAVDDTEVESTIIA